MDETQVDLGKALINLAEAVIDPIETGGVFRQGRADIRGGGSDEIVRLVCHLRNLPAAISASGHSSYRTKLPRIDLSGRSYPQHW